MPQFKDLPEDFRCPYRDGCPYLEGLSTRWVWEEYQRSASLECDYEHQLKELYQQLEQQRLHSQKIELQNQATPGSTPRPTSPPVQRTQGQRCSRVGVSFD